MRDAVDPLAPHRRRLLGLAYRMLGSSADAEDIVQDAYLKFSKATGIENQEAWLVRTVTRQCIDHIRSARARREVYVGPWLPEPVLDGATSSPEAAIELAEDISFAFLLMLQELSAPERAAFLLHDIFDLGFGEVAGILGRSEAACRQLATRARKALRRQRPVRPSPSDGQIAILAAFREALSAGDVGQIASLLRDDAVLVADGGGIRLAARNPVVGADRIGRFLAGVRRKYVADPHRTRWVETVINGTPGAVTLLDGKVEQAMLLAFAEDRIAAIYIVRNPEKLRSLAKAMAPASAFASGQETLQ